MLNKTTVAKNLLLLALIANNLTAAAPSQEPSFWQTGKSFCRSNAATIGVIGLISAIFIGGAIVNYDINKRTQNMLSNEYTVKKTLHSYSSKEQKRIIRDTVLLNLPALLNEAERTNSTDGLIQSTLHGFESCKQISIGHMLHVKYKSTNPTDYTDVIKALLLYSMHRKEDESIAKAKKDILWIARAMVYKFNLVAGINPQVNLNLPDCKKQLEMYYKNCPNLAPDKKIHFDSEPEEIKAAVNKKMEEIIAEQSNAAKELLAKEDTTKKTDLLIAALTKNPDLTFGEAHKLIADAPAAT